MECGLVKAFNPSIGRLAISNNRGWVIADIHWGEAAVGDEIHGVMDEHGAQVWRNATRNGRLEVYVEGFDADQETARKLLNQQR